LGVELLGADAPMSFIPLSFDWARDTVVGAIMATNPPRIRAPQTFGIFMQTSKWPRRDNDRTSDRDRAVSRPNAAGNAKMRDPTTAHRALRERF